VEEVTERIAVSFPDLAMTREMTRERRLWQAQAIGACERPRADLGSGRHHRRMV
jgi:hypothetical protein